MTVLVVSLVYLTNTAAAEVTEQVVTYLQFDVAPVTMRVPVPLHEHDHYDDERGEHERADHRSCYHERHACPIYTQVHCMHFITSPPPT